MTEVAMSRVDEIEARANTDLAVERNGYQPTEMMGVQQKYFVRIQKETLELIATIRALQEENEGLRDGINSICACLHRADALAPKDTADLRIEIKEAIHRARRAYKFGVALKDTPNAD